MDEESFTKIITSCKTTGADIIKWETALEGKGEILLRDPISRAQRASNVEIIYINAENTGQYLRKVLAWLQFDLNQSKDKSKSFYHNRNTIEKAFAQHTAMVAVKNNEVVGFMTWNTQKDSCEAEIIIVEIKASCRRQGIFAAMLSTFANSFSGIHVLTARALSQADTVFTTMGWTQVQGTKRNEGDLNFYYHVIRPVAPELAALPDGATLAVFSKADVPATTELVDAYSVIKGQNRYKKKYFKLELDSTGQLLVPIVKPFHYEGYVALYHNQKLIAEGKLKHLFQNEHCGDLLVLQKIKLKNPQHLAQLQLFFEAKNSSSAPPNTLLPAPYQSTQSVVAIQPDSAQKSEEEKPPTSVVSASLSKLLDNTTTKRPSETATLPMPEAKKSTTIQTQKNALPGAGKGI
jgi:N-acetylglutamate synthase-like GNAT family acetyltransferase